jgi:hypothetical protein
MKKVTSAVAASTTFLFAATSAFAQGNDITLGISPPAQVGIRNINRLIGSLIGSIIVVSIVVALFYLLWGGFSWITSGGDEGKVEAAQKKIQAALIGLILIAAVYALFTLVANWLGFNLNNLTLPSPTGD